MKKPFDFRERGPKVCIRCNRPLKKNLLARKPRAVFCYKHWVAEEGMKGHNMRKV
jgi:hypothetical protein